MDSRKRVEKPSLIPYYRVLLKIDGEERLVEVVERRFYLTLFQAALYGTDKYCNNVKGFLIGVLKSMGERYWYRDKERQGT